MSDRPTPETDAAARKGAYLAHGEYPETRGKQLVHIDFARKLERERDEARAELRKLRIENNHNWQAIEFAEETVKERDEAFALLASEKSTRNSIIAKCVELEKQLKAMREMLLTMRAESEKIFSATAELPDCGLIHQIASSALAITTMTPTTEPKLSNEIREKILAVVDEKHGAFWGEFYDALIPAHTVEEVRLALRSLILDRTLRMKEDSTEHDWEYRRNR